VQRTNKAVNHPGRFVEPGIFDGREPKGCELTHFTGWVASNNYIDVYEQKTADCPVAWKGGDC
jgi:hypothetical protein